MFKKATRAITGIGLAAVLTFGAFGTTAAVADTSTTDDQEFEQVVEWTKTAPMDELLATDGTTEVDGPISNGSASVTARAGTGYAKVTCTMKINDPHYSKGAGGAIFKTVVTCTGTGVPSVTVRLNSGLYFSTDPKRAGTERASSDYNQVVAVNGPSKTYYVPQEGINGNGGTGNGYWNATSVIQIIAPGKGTVGSETRQVKKNIVKP